MKKEINIQIPILFPYLLSNQNIIKHVDDSESYFSLIFYAKPSITLCSPAEEYCLKMLRNDNQQHSLKLFKNEAKILDLLPKHLNIIKFFEFQQTKYFTFLVLEYASNGDLFKQIAKSKKGFPDGIARNCFKKIINVLQIMKGLSLAHRDIKSDNIVFDSNFDLKLIDFAYACDCTKKTTRKNPKGSESYMSPEMQRGEA